jgi:predicted membrane protein
VFVFVLCFSLSLSGCSTYTLRHIIIKCWHSRAIIIVVLVKTVAHSFILIVNHPLIPIREKLLIPIWLLVSSFIIIRQWLSNVQNKNINHETDSNLIMIVLSFVTFFFLNRHYRRWLFVVVQCIIICMIMIQHEKKRRVGKRDEEKEHWKEERKEQREREREREKRESVISYHFYYYTTSSTYTQSTIFNMNGTIKCEAIRWVFQQKPFTYNTNMWIVF